jgi:DNA invertase Pin-like site-specific DNA recombinase
MVAAKQPSATSATNQGILMRKFQPSLVDWDEIKERVLAGEGYTSVAKDYEVSRQAIQKRCNKEEWIANKPRSMAVKRELFKRNQKAQPIATAQPVAVAVQPAQPVVLREDKRAAIIQLLADGVPKTHAAAVAGVSEATLHRWVNEDDKFKSEVRAAESAAVALRVQRIGKAGEKDWRADSWYLERTQRGTFGSDAGKGGGLAVQINIMRDGEPEVVDITPAG